MKTYDEQYEDYDNPIDDIYPEVFHHQLKEDLKIGLDTLDRDSIMTPGIHHKYLSMKKRAKGRLEEAEVAHRDIIHGLHIYYEGKAPADVYKHRPLDIVIPKAEIERFIKCEPTFKASEKIVNLWKRRIEFLNKVVEQIGNRSYLIHNAIEYLKYTKGGD
jgi:hypothetical protein